MHKGVDMKRMKGNGHGVHHRRVGEFADSREFELPNIAQVRKEEATWNNECWWWM